MKIFQFIVLGFLALGLSGCETMNQWGNSISQSVKSIEMPSLATKTEQSSDPLLSIGGAACPQIKGVSDLVMITQFADGKPSTNDNMIADTKLEKIDSTCTVSDNSVAVEMSLDFAGTLGPIGVKDLNGQANYTYPYFLVVVSADGKIMAKDVFALSMVYENGQISYRRRETLRQVIPITKNMDTSKFQIMVGFQLTEDELAYNRSHIALTR